ncbi:MAG: hypothetical protein KF771_08445 [Burkholderiales bacterium]|nr:hypothetical protein [Burkholderiales bacterium]
MHHRGRPAKRRKNPVGSAQSGKIGLFRGNTMEAERINAITNRLNDLDERAGALRRYL